MLTVHYLAGMELNAAYIRRQACHFIQGNFKVLFSVFFSSGVTTSQWAMASSFERFLDHTQRRTTVGRTPLDE